MKKKLLKIFLILSGVTLIILILLPDFVKRYAIKHSKELVGRQININKLKYNYFTSTVKVYDFKMLEENEQENFIDFDTLVVDLEPLQLFNDKIEIEDFYLKGLDVQVIMKDSVFNFDDLIDFHSASEDSISQNTETPPFKFSVSNINIEESDFRFNNQDIEHITNIENLSFLIPFIGWDQEEKSNADVKFNFPRGGFFESKLNINPINGAYDATITISELYLDPFYKYVAEYAEINSFNGVLNSEINIIGNTNEAVKSIVSGLIEINDFSMTDQQDKKFLAAKKISSNLKDIDAFNNSYIIDSLIVKQAYTNFNQDSITNNFIEIFKIDSSNEAPKQEIEVTENDSIYYTVNYFEIQNGIMDYADNLMGTPTNYSFTNINLKADSISNNKQWRNIQSEMRVNKEGLLGSKIDFHPIEGNFSILLTSQNLNLDPFYKYIVEYANINTIKGQLNTELNINGSVKEIKKLLVSGLIEVSDFSMTDAQNKKFTSSKNILCDIKEVNTFNSSYKINKFIITEPYFYFEMDSISNNLSKIFYLDEDSKNESNLNASESSELFYTIDHLEVQNGIVDYTDNLTGNPFNYHLSAIEIESGKIKSNSNWIQINSEMLLNNRGTLKAQLGYNPANTDNIDLDFSIEKFLLSDINIYAKYYMGHTILEGDMYYQSKSKVTNGNIESENKLLIKEVSLNSTEKGLYNLPLKFALFLLKDKNGDVNLDIPVQGDLNDPSINVGKIVWNTFKNLIVKAAASPGKLLAGLVGGEPKDIEEIQFTYLDTVPSEKNRKQLDKLLELEQKKEGLKIEMLYYVDTNLQKEAIAKAEVGKLYFKETNKDYLKDETSFEAYAMNKIIPDSLSLKQAYLKIITEKHVDSLLLNNNRILISNTEQYLKTVNDSTQIKILRTEILAPENTGSMPLLKVIFSLRENE